MPRACGRRLVESDVGRKLKKKREGRGAEPAPEARLAGLGPLLPVGAVFFVLLVAVGGLEWLRGQVLSATEYNPPVKLKLEYMPGAEWVEQEGWLSRISSSIRIPTERKLMDGDLVRFVSAQASQSGWVRSVRQVSRAMDGTVRVCCDYRRPIAMIYTNRGGSSKYIPVDQEGVRLPEEYDNVESDSGWIRILGVESEPPPVGRAYGETREDSDAVAAVRLAFLLFSQAEIADKITAIDVSNLNGRRDRFKPPIVVFPRGGGPGINWGSPIGSEVEEPELAYKLRNLALLLKTNSPQACADLTVYRNGVIVSNPAQGLK